MQIVIDIPEEVYKNIQCLDWKNGGRWFSEEWTAIHNGTPCETVTEFADRCRECGREKVLDKISAEIDQKQYDFMSDGDYDEGIRFGLMLAYQIIDKYKAESEKL